MITCDFFFGSNLLFQIAANFFISNILKQL